MSCELMLKNHYSNLVNASKAYRLMIAVNPFKVCSLDTIKHSLLLVFGQIIFRQYCLEWTEPDRQKYLLNYNLSIALK